MRKLLLRSFQSPGDVLMLTAAVRDLHNARPNQFQTDVRTSADALWNHNPFITPLRESDSDVEVMDVHYPLIHSCNQRPYHFIHGYAQYLEEQLDLRIPLTQFHGDVHLSSEEKEKPPPCAKNLPEHFWIIVAGGKFDFTAKWWSPASSQRVVDFFQNRIQFVQCGEEGHWHPRLEGVIDLIGKTSLREFVWLMHHADGVVCPVTFAMHLAAAVETRSGSSPLRPCVVLGGGREPPHWEAYPHHQYISTVGTLSCCEDGGCWRSRCQLVGDGDDKDWRNVCEQPVQVTPELRIAKCMEMIRPEDVIRRIELYHESTGWPMQRGDSNGRAPVTTATEAPKTIATKKSEPVLIRFRHGLGDAVQLTLVLQHLKHHHPDWEVDVGALIGKHSAFHGLCNAVFRLDVDSPPRSDYKQIFDLEWPECVTCFSDWPSTKAERCLVEIFHLTPKTELCSYVMQPGREASTLARRYLEDTCRVSLDVYGRYPVVLIHYEGNTSPGEKNLSVEIARDLCEDILGCGAVPVILDWDARTPLADEQRIFNPHVHVELWGGTGTGDAEVLAALTELATLMVGVDSGPLHVAGATGTPTVGVWTGHHPLHYFSPADNVTHLVPENHVSLLRGNRTAGGQFFEKHYRYQIYQDLGTDLRSLVKHRLNDTEGALVFSRNFWIRSDNSEQDLVVVNDIVEQDSYHVHELPMPQPVVVDVGAHIGCFSWKLHQRNPLARIIAVECCPENVSVLQKNVGGFATVIQGAVTYEEEVALLNAVFPNCESTGGTTVLPREQIQKRVDAGNLETSPNGKPAQHWADFRPVKRVTLEELLAQHQLDRIDVLKLDCEGSEFSILGSATVLDQIGIIVGEYHGRDRFHQLVQERFSNWELRILKDGELGTFWLANPNQRTEVATRVMVPATPIRPTLPTVLLAALRTESENHYDLLRAEGGQIYRSYEHPRGHLRGFARTNDQLWTIDSYGILYVVQINGTSIELNEVSSSPLAWEAHDLTIIDGCLATAGPAQNAIALFDPATEQWTARRPWVPALSLPTEKPTPDRLDRHHLNSIVQDGNSIVLSLFSVDPKPEGQRWRDRNLDEGLIIRWGQNGFHDNPIASGVYVPHSLRKHKGKIWWCESFRGTLCREDGWRSPHVGGFTRGLAFLKDGRCIVGLSRSRVAPNPTLERCGFCVFDPDQPEDCQYVELDLPYIEVYDVWPEEG